MSTVPHNLSFVQNVGIGHPRKRSELGDKVYFSLTELSVFVKPSRPSFPVSPLITLRRRASGIYHRVVPQLNQHNCVMRDQR